MYGEEIFYYNVKWCSFYINFGQVPEKCTDRNEMWSKWLVFLKVVEARGLPNTITTI